MDPADKTHIVNINHKFFLRILKACIFIALFILSIELLLSVTPMYKHSYMGAEPDNFELIILFIKNDLGLDAVLAYFLLSIPIVLFFTICVSRWILILYTPLCLIFSPYEDYLRDRDNILTELHYIFLALSFLALLSYVYNMLLSKARVYNVIGDTFIWFVITHCLLYIDLYQFQDYSFGTSFALILNLLLIFVLTIKRIDIKLHSKRLRTQ